MVSTYIVLESGTRVTFICPSTTPAFRLNCSTIFSISIWFIQPPCQLYPVGPAIQTQQSGLRGPDFCRSMIQPRDRNAASRPSFRAGASTLTSSSNVPSSSYSSVHFRASSRKKRIEVSWSAKRCRMSGTLPGCSSSRVWWRNSSRLPMAKPPSIRARSAISSEMLFSSWYWVSKRVCSSKKSAPRTFQWAQRVFVVSTTSSARVMLRSSTTEWRTSLSNPIFGWIRTGSFGLWPSLRLGPMWLSFHWMVFLLPYHPKRKELSTSLLQPIKYLPNQEMDWIDFLRVQVVSHPGHRFKKLAILPQFFAQAPEIVV